MWLWQDRLRQALTDRGRNGLGRVMVWVLSSWKEMGDRWQDSGPSDGEMCSVCWAEPQPCRGAGKDTALVAAAAEAAA